MNRHRSLEPYLCSGCQYTAVYSRRRADDDPIICTYCGCPLELVHNSPVRNAPAYAQAFGPKAPSGRSILGGERVKYLDVGTFARLTGKPRRSVQRWCKEERLEGAFQMNGENGKWSIPGYLVDVVAQNGADFPS